MKALKLVVLTIALLLVSSAWSVAFDFGASVESSTGYTTGVASSFTEQVQGSAWLNTDLGTNLSFSVNGYVRLIEDFLADESLLPSHAYQYFGLRQLRLSATLNPPSSPAFVEIAAGRIAVSEFSGLILATSLDAARIRFSYPNAQLSFTTGFTGLTGGHTSSILLSRTDLLRASDDAAFFGPRRLIGVGQLSLPALLAEQTLTLAAVYQEDLGPPSGLGYVTVGTEDFQSTAGGELDTQYWGFGVSGPIIARLYQQTIFYLGTGRTLSYLADEDSQTGSSYQYAPILSYLAGLRFRYFFPGSYSALAGIQAIYASGDADYSSYYEGNTAGNGTQFITMTPSGSGLIFSPNLGNVVQIAIDYSMRPFTAARNIAIVNTQVSARALTFFRAGAGPVSVVGVDTGGDAGYLGTEADVIFGFRPFSDLGAGVSVGMFVPGTAFSQDAPVQWLVRADLSFSL